MENGNQKSLFSYILRQEMIVGYVTIYILVHNLAKKQTRVVKILSDSRYNKLNDNYFISFQFTLLFG